MGPLGRLLLSLLLLSWEGKAISEYMVTMFDTNTQELRWNATYNDYSAPPYDEKQDYKMAHLVSSGDGLVVTVDRESGRRTLHIEVELSVCEGASQRTYTACTYSLCRKIGFPPLCLHFPRPPGSLVSGHHELPPIAHTTMLRDVPTHPAAFWRGSHPPSAFCSPYLPCLVLPTALYRCWWP
ncbi:Serine/threonine-protein kinase/endoribonuclease IRE1 [Larimichthys crocea]|uniref:Uncharacterized protein n=1 Tax=Larimichthys crocea TaxID=215358 RepID=A0ACD3RWF5_LARCR|nr:Serine/threonine-protein kinase/endoribonuclease IRE1 [Larimichthys crocea]